MYANFVTMTGFIESKIMLSHNEESTHKDISTFILRDIGRQVNCRIKCFNEEAVNLNEHCLPGDKITIMGHLSQEDNGELFIVAESIQYYRPREDSNIYRNGILGSGDDNKEKGKSFTIEDIL